MGNILTVEGRPTAGALFSCAVLIAVTAICLDVNFTRELAARLARSAAKCPQPPHALREQLSAADPPRELGGLVRCSVLAQAKALAEGVGERGDLPVHPAAVLMCVSKPFTRLAAWVSAHGAASHGRPCQHSRYTAR